MIGDTRNEAAAWCSKGRISESGFRSPQEVAASSSLAYRFSTREHSCSAMAATSQTCQWEKRPEAIAKLLANLRSAAMRHIASTDATRAAGVSSAPATRASFRLRLRLLPSLGPLPNRMRTTMEVRYQSYQFLR